MLDRIPSPGRNAVVALALLAIAWPNSARSTETGLQGRWQIVAVDGRQVSAGQLQFEAGRFGGKTACNRVGGHFKRTDGQLTFGPLVMTKMACQPDVMALERSTVDAIAAVRTLAGGPVSLTLLDETGRERIRLARAT
jgi:heat shock protein HslJ